MTRIEIARILIVLEKSRKMDEIIDGAYGVVNDINNNKKDIHFFHKFADHIVDSNNADYDAFKPIDFSGFKD